jgi:hypothetical protein
MQQFNNRKTAIESLHYERILIKERLERKYEEIYQKCLSEAKHRISMDAPAYMHEIPPLDPTEKKYDLIDCIYYVERKLKKEGCDVKYVYPNYLWISLKDTKEELERLKKIQYLCCQDMKTRLIYTTQGSLEPEYKPLKYNIKSITYN